MEAPVATPAPAGLPVPSRRVLVLIGGALVLATVLWFGRDVLAPFIVGLLLVYLLDPVVERLARIRVAGRGAPRWLLILLVYVVVVLVLAELLLLLVGPLIEQVQAFIQDAPGYLETVNQRLSEAFSWWNRLDLPADVRAAIDQALRDLPATIASFIPSLVRPVFTSVVGLVGAVFGYLIIPVWAFWILKDRPAITRAFDRAVPAPWRADTWATLGIVRRVFGSWIRGQIVLGLVVGIATFIGLVFLGVAVDPVFGRYSVLLAVIAGVLELLPIIGPIIAAVPAVLLGATAGTPGIVAALVLYFAIQQLENNILVPKIQGDATNLHPAVVIFSLIVGGAIAGLLGAILALPVAATMRDLYIYAFRRAGGMTPEQAATGNARTSDEAIPAASQRPPGPVAQVGLPEPAAAPPDVPVTPPPDVDVRSDDVEAKPVGP